MKKIVTFAAVAALATLSACTKEDAAAPEAVATETVANEVELNDDGTVKEAVDRSEANVDKRKNPNEQIP